MDRSFDARRSSMQRTIIPAMSGLMSIARNKNPTNDLPRLSARNATQKLKIIQHMIIHMVTNWGLLILAQRRAHPPLGARERHAHGVEFVVTESHGSREPLGVG